MGTVGFSGGYTLVNTNLGSYSLATGYTYTSGDAIVWDTVSPPCPYIGYETTGVNAGTFTAKVSGVYRMKMYIALTGFVSAVSMFGSLMVNFNNTPPFPTWNTQYVGFGGAFNATDFVVPLVFNYQFQANDIFKFALFLTGATTIDFTSGIASQSSISCLPS